MNIRTLGVFCGILSGFFWGTMDIAAQYLLHTVRMAPAQFISLTMVVTTVALFAISIATKPKETFLAATDKRNVFQFFLFGVLVLLTQVSFYVCVKYSNAETAAVIAATRPFCIMGLLLFAAVMPTASQILCCALALVGVCLMMTKGDFSTLSFGWLTLLVGFGAPLFSAAYTIQSRSIVRKVGPLIAMTWAMLFTTILCNLYYPFWKVSLEWNFLTSLSVLWVAIMGHIVAYTLYIVSASKILPTITGVLETIEPLTAIVLSYFFFSQKMNAFMLAGAAMVLVSVVILVFSKPREKAN